jgi:hypothetical protein
VHALADDDGDRVEPLVEDDHVERLPGGVTRTWIFSSAIA